MTLTHFGDWSEGACFQEPASLYGFAVSGPEDLQSAHLQSSHFELQDAWNDRPDIPSGQEMEILMLLGGNQARSEPQLCADSTYTTDSFRTSQDSAIDFADVQSHADQTSLLQHKVP